MTTLEKIKAEIEEARYGLINDGLDVALEIVDKYAEQETKWIPVSERLPEENKQVLIQYRTRYRDDVNLFDVTSRADCNYWQGIGREIDVIAWMPLPEPYEPQKSGLTDEMMEHYKKLAEHYNGGTHESIQDTNDGK